MRDDPKILVATPGRLNDYLSEGDVRAKFSEMKTLVLDEADRMLDAGFLGAILKILEALPSKTTGRWQGMCFSVRIFGVYTSSLEPDHGLLDPSQEYPLFRRAAAFERSTTDADITI